jgi:TatD DNase family protein
VETDAPYLLPRPASRGNEPALLRHVARVVAQCRGESFGALAAHTTRAARARFGIG